jgi:hypothetical protein
MFEFKFYPNVPQVERILRKIQRMGPGGPAYVCPLDFNGHPVRDLQSALLEQNFAHVLLYLVRKIIGGQIVNILPKRVFNFFSNQLNAQ